MSSPRSWIRILFVVLVTSVCAEMCFAQSAPADFSIVILPDPQNYSASYPQVFAAQTQWIVDNAAALNIRMVVGDGDMVYHDSIATEWQNASAAVSILDGKVPYAFSIGNHDYDNEKASARGATQFNTYFGPLRYASYSWYGGNYNGSNENFYTFFSDGANEYMVLALEFYPRDEVITWAHSVLSAHPEKRVIVVTHSFEGTDGMRVDLCDTNDVPANFGNNPQLVWSKLLKQHANVFMVLSGHLIGNGSAHRGDLGDNKNLVNQIFSNFQDWTGTKLGYLRILKFHPSMNTIDVITYSPWVNTYETSSTYQFTLPWMYQGTALTSGGIEGKVRGKSCIKIKGAQVSTAGVTATTNSNGVYRISAIPAPSGYGLNVAVPYYGAGSALDNVDAGFNTQVNFFLDQTVTASCALSALSPSVTICSPTANATVISPVHVNAGAKSSRTLVYMQVYIDGVNRGTFYTSAVDQDYVLTEGAHKITVQARDSSDTFTKQSVYVTAAATPTLTSVAIMSPLNDATMTSLIPVKAEATAGTGVTITSSTIYLDGVNVYHVYSPTVNTTIAAKVGTHRLTVQVKDSAGVYTKSTIYVTVK